MLKLLLDFVNEIESTFEQERETKAPQIHKSTNTQAHQHRMESRYTRVRSSNQTHRHPRCPKTVKQPKFIKTK